MESSGGVLAGQEVGRRCRGGQVVENFEGEEEYFETDAMFDREPVKRLQNRSDVFVGPGVGEVAPAESRTIWSLWRD